jgi:glycerol-3-phosphate dehydrogenase
LSADEVYAHEPHLGPGAVGGLLVPDEGLLDPWAVTLNLATEAVVNGAQLWRSRPVTGVHATPDGHLVRCGDREAHTRWVVDAAGLDSDVVDRWLGHDDFTVTPRRGQLIVFDKLARRLLRHIVLPVPTATTKGVLISPTVYGNVLLGPTAEDLDDRTATQTTQAGLQQLLAHGRRILPALLDEEVTATYAGLRAATEHSDYQYAVFKSEHYVRVGGIRSTGVSAALALAEQVVADLADAGMPVEPVAGFRTWRVPDLSEGPHRAYLDQRRIAQDGECGRIVCHCERVSRREVLDALDSPVPPVDAEGLKRRTRALMGRCQGFYCGATVARLLRDPAPAEARVG